jgi:hypothetical protein
VEKDKGCQDLIMKWFEDDSCVFGDILDLCASDIPEDKLLEIKQVKLKKAGHCLRHNQQCRATVDQTHGLGALGAPWVLFSKILSV